MNRRLVIFATVLGAVLLASCASDAPVWKNRIPTSSSPKMMSKRIVMFFDGTRNVPDSHTNVHRLYVKVGKMPVAPDGKSQQAIYMQGVGTRMTDLVTGAAFGRGISRDVQQGYEELREVYEQGDEIWIFGFSRGAFTARSLAAFLAHYGVLQRNAGIPVKELYKNYRVANPQRPMAFLTKVATPEQLSDWDKRLLSQTQEVDIEFLGVWDTVGTIGLPIPAGRLSRKANMYHFMAPRMAYKKCRQALAIDEFRPHYRPILWKRFIPEDSLREGQAPPPSELDQRYEQRWFVGAHSNVGGGYKDPSDLYKVSLRWMEGEAAESGLGIADRESPASGAHRARINDSFGEFWPYKIAFWTKPQPRPIQRGGEDKAAARGDTVGAKGRVFTLNETIDDSVYDRVDRGGQDGSAYYFPRQ